MSPLDLLVAQSIAHERERDLQLRLRQEHDAHGRGSHLPQTAPPRGGAPRRTATPREHHLLRSLIEHLHIPRPHPH
ncbi:hypothetical protein MWU75_17285 [Ornithinimicrobium sp. F0845]|uniref:hypothetical protein n=1 Tax=Ornithinimicrobium sp. F0845 TaxID=2926412 RepID=UPI001FF3E64B|nr:hypothetical protein [Ornithinimicrobium sp. F0845]MCK0113901.1 hypothetical protein [Ornithinimicrobium sp. F0845]